MKDEFEILPAARIKETRRLRIIAEATPGAAGLLLAILWFQIPKSTKLLTDSDSPSMAGID
ncbi:MAG TPA: hypothetical protein PLZ31_10060 [Myxococcota bacterium]|nr:hypothetical protein [Myxococcota bacterium]HPB51553.1 hypothetical protein [Myxococcota bacterium]